MKKGEHHVIGRYRSYCRKCIVSGNHSYRHEYLNPTGKPDHRGKNQHGETRCPDHFKECQLISLREYKTDQKNFDNDKPEPACDQDHTCFFETTGLFEIEIDADPGKEDECWGTKMGNPACEEQPYRCLRYISGAVCRITDVYPG